MSIKEIKDKVLEDLLKEFRINYSYKDLDIIQDARCRINKYNFKKDNFSKGDKFVVKEVNLNGWNKFFYIKTNIKMIEYCNRDRARKNYLKHKHKIIKLSDFVKIFGLTIDVYQNGSKRPLDMVRIMYNDFNTYIQLPIQYRSIENFDFVVRPYFKELIDRTESNDIIFDVPDPDKVLIFVDGKLTSKNYYVKTDEGYSFHIKDPQDASEFVKELVYIETLYKREKVKENTKNLKIQGKFQFPLGIDNMLCFCNNLYYYVDILPKSSNIFKLSQFPGNMEIVIMYDVKHGDINQYTDKIQWYADRYDIIDDMNLKEEPEFVREFKVSDINMSMLDFDLAKKKVDVYNSDKLKEIMLYDFEFYNLYIDRYSFYIDFEKSTFTNFSKVDIDDYIRFDNKKEILNPSMWREFGVPHVLIKMHNPDQRKFRLYLDGNAIFESLNYYEAGYTYIYVRRSSIKDNTCIEATFNDLNETAYRTDFNVAKDAKAITIKNANLVNGHKYLSLYDRTNNTHVDINNVSITGNNAVRIEPKNILSKSSSYSVVNGYTCKIYKHSVRENAAIEVGITFFISPEFNMLPHKKGCYRAYRGSRLFPKKYVDIKFPEETGQEFIQITIKAEFSRGEKIFVEFVPFEEEEIYYERKVDPLGRIRPDKGILNIPFNDNIMTYYLNGRRLNPSNIEKHTNNGIVYKNVSSINHCSVLIRKERYEHINDFVETYNSKRDLYDEFRKFIMNGYIIKDTEKDILLGDRDYLNNLYYELYIEFLKHNIIDAAEKMPDYIIIKYQELMEQESYIVIDCNDDFKYWKLLDSDKRHDKDKERILIDDKVYEILTTESVRTIPIGEIPIEIYNKYKYLFEKNTVLVESYS